MLTGRINSLGKAPLCNMKAARAPHIGPFVFPLCWRCLGVGAGLVGGVPMGMLLAPVHRGMMLAVVAILVAPLMVDGLLQRLGHMESTNTRRLVTGMLCGVGLEVLHVIRF
jgi:uncharacterized membrane protein